jgi:phosphoglycerol transferase MdoB-like AlkP superfamily enzyme
MRQRTSTIDGPVASGRELVLLLAKLGGALLLVCTLGRLALMTWQWTRLEDLSPASRLLALLHGLRMDTILVSVALLPPLLLLTLLPRPLGAAAALATRAWALAVLMLVVFVEIATFPFFAQYDVRPNLLFVQYLDYPVEVAKLLWNEQRANLLLAVVVLTVLALAFVRRRLLGEAHALAGARWRHRVLWFLPLALLAALGARSSLGHRPANLSDALYSPNRVANEIAKNSVYSVAYEAYRASRDGGGKATGYGAMPLDEAYTRTRRLRGIGAPARADRPLSRPLPVTHPSAKPRNLVIIVQESMSGAFVGHLGYPNGVTPNLDALSRESITLTRLHAAGTRSIQGLAAMSAGFPAPPGEGVLKRNKAQRDFFTLAALLKPLGYHASFLYGGEARFDDMRVWYLGNGFDEVVEQKDFRNPSFVATWGVSDEDLLRKAHERYLAHHAAGRPFVSVVFSQSNHAPFELPEGKIDWEPGVPKASVRNAVKYADYAIGQFMALAKASPYYRDTVFVVVADHTERAHGDDAVPVPGFHIPGVVHLAGVPPQRIDTIAWQPDLLATALGMLGVPLQAPVFGNSVFAPGRQAFALMNFNGTYGLLRGDQVAVLRPDKPAQTYRYDGSRLHDAPADAELQRDALALVHAVEDLYESQRYR